MLMINIATVKIHCVILLLKMQLMIYASCQQREIPISSISHIKVCVICKTIVVRVDCTWRGMMLNVDASTCVSI